jgi:uncharacterized protein YidB (DUF937 family)
MGVLDSLMNRYGGDLNQLVGKFESSGLGDKVQSWIGTGSNHSVSGQEIKQALGQDEVDQVAREAGVSSDQAADELARDLPNAVDKATPDGSIPGIDDVKKALGGLLGG